jgi:hypothetical protein
MNNHIIETIADFDPSKVHVTKEEYNTIKRKKPDKPFAIKDEKLANALIMLDLIQRHEIDIPKDAPEYSVFCHTKPSGKYILGVKGKRYLSYRKSLRSSKFWVEFRAWITLAIAFVSLLLSICSLILDIISKLQKG